MTRLRKFSILWLGLLFVLAACSSAEPDLTAKSAENAEADKEVVTATSASSAAVSPTDQPPNTPTAQPTAEQTPMPQPIKANYPHLGVAPEIENEVWLNTDQPVTLASQRGKVVLVEFWTFG
ncbi:MAG: hypothetical protein IAF02_19295 [Anaerolineae bacterium]|nr:hypothetical protein [Anaerolineae bacterium]